MVDLVWKHLDCLLLWFTFRNFEFVSEGNKHFPCTFLFIAKENILPQRPVIVMQTLLGQQVKNMVNYNKVFECVTGVL